MPLATKFGASFGFVTLIALVAAQNQPPEYIKQCKLHDSQLITCLKGALHHLRPYLARGIPEIEMPPVEPFIMDTLSLQLTGGPQGYKISLKNMEIYGASNYTIEDIKLSKNGEPFEASVTMPRLVIHSKYQSSGVLLIIPAGGSGEFDGLLDGVVGYMKGTVSTKKRDDGNTYMHIDKLELDMTFKKARMRISKAFKNNRILTEATNLFLHENGSEVIKLMEPQLKKKLSSKFQSIANQLLTHVPMEQFILE